MEDTYSIPCLCIAISKLWTGPIAVAMTWTLLYVNSSINTCQEAGFGFSIVTFEIVSHIAQLLCSL